MKPQDVKNWTSTLQKLQALKPTKLKAETLKDSTLGHKENESTSGPKSLRTWKPKIYEPEGPKTLRWKLQKSNESESQKSMRVKPIKSANLQAQKNESMRAASRTTNAEQNDQTFSWFIVSHILSVHRAVVHVPNKYISSKSMLKMQA